MNKRLEPSGARDPRSQWVLMDSQEIFFRKDQRQLPEDEMKLLFPVESRNQLCSLIYCKCYCYKG